MVLRSFQPEEPSVKHSSDDFACPSCGRSTRREKVYVTMWLGGELNLIEDVPAYVCADCSEQYYDKDIEEKIRALIVEGFPARKARHFISVPVFDLDPMSTADKAGAARQAELAKEVSQS